MEICMSSMAWHLLPESGTILSADGELFENQRAEQGIYWTLWDSSLSDDLNTASIYSDNHNRGVQSFDTSEHCSTRPSDSEEQPGYPSPFEPVPQHMEQTNDMFLSQFSDEEVRRMDSPLFEALDMFPDSMHRLLSYEHMLGGVLLSGSQNQETNMDQDDMDTCGFPLYISHGLHDDDQVKVDGGLPRCAKLLKPTSPEMVAADSYTMDKGGVSATARSCPVAADEASSPSSEEAVLDELEEVVIQMASKTRICFRDAFYRLAESSRARAPCSAAADVVAEPRRHRRRRPEREANAIDRTVVDLAFRPPCSAAQGAPWIRSRGDDAAAAHACLS